MADLLQPFAGKGASQLAQRLRDRFGSLSRAMEAPRQSLLDAAGPYATSCDLLLAARELFEVAARETLASASVDARDARILNHLRQRLGRLQEERMLVIFCARDKSFLLDEMFGIGGRDTIRLTVSALFRRALTVGAEGFLLAHNHPSGRCLPSEADKIATRELETTARSLQLDFLDHIIVTRDCAYSMRDGGYLA